MRSQKSSKLAYYQKWAHAMERKELKKHTIFSAWISLVFCVPACVSPGHSAQVIVIMMEELFVQNNRNGNICITFTFLCGKNNTNCVLYSCSIAAQLLNSFFSFTPATEKQFLTFFPFAFHVEFFLSTKFVFIKLEQITL